MRSTATITTPPASIKPARRPRRRWKRRACRWPRLLNADTPKEIVFTSGGTEADNHAIKGVAMANADKGKHIVTTNVEHNAVIRSLRRIKSDGFTVTSLSVDDKGRVNPRDVAEAVTKETILISVMHSNNETGTIQPIEEIAAIAREKKILFHTDAVDSVGIVPFDVKKIGADLVSFASNTFYGPTGVGGLYIRRGAKVFRFSTAAFRRTTSAPAPKT